MSDPVPPLPSTPPQPPPRLPPVVSTAAPAAVIRWGIGDVFLGLLAYLVGGVVIGVVLVVTGTVGEDGKLENLGLPAVALALAGGWLGFLGWPLVATHLKGQRSMAKDFGLSIRWIDLAWGALGGFAALALSVMGGILWHAITGEDSPSNGGFLPQHPSVLEGVALFLLVAVCTPIAEETFFRGLVLRSVGRRWNLTVGVIASSVVFGMFHFEGSIGHGLFISGVTAMYGAVFALLVVRAGGRLGPSIVAHACVNGIAVVALVAGWSTV